MEELLPHHPWLLCEVGIGAAAVAHAPVTHQQPKVHRRLVSDAAQEDGYSTGPT